MDIIDLEEEMKLINYEEKISKDANKVYENLSKLIVDVNKYLKFGSFKLDSSNSFFWDSYVKNFPLANYSNYNDIEKELHSVIKYSRELSVKMNKSLKERKEKIAKIGTINPDSYNMRKFPNPNSDKYKVHDKTGGSICLLNKDELLSILNQIIAFRYSNSSDFDNDDYEKKKNMFKEFAINNKWTYVYFIGDCALLSTKPINEISNLTFNN